MADLTTACVLSKSLTCIFIAEHGTTASVDLSTLARIQRAFMQALVRQVDDMVCPFIDGNVEQDSLLCTVGVTTRV